MKTAVNRIHFEQNMFQAFSRGGRSHFFRLRIRSFSKLFWSVSGSGYFSNLRIRLLFRLRLPSIRPKLYNFSLKKWPRRLLMPKLKSDSGSGNFDAEIWRQNITKFWPGLKEKRRILPESTPHSGSMATTGFQTKFHGSRAFYFCLYSRTFVLPLQA